MRNPFYSKKKKHIMIRVAPRATEKTRDVMDFQFLVREYKRIVERNNKEKLVGDIICGYSPSILESIRKITDENLPLEYEDLYKFANGQDGGSGIFFGYEYLTLEHSERDLRSNYASFKMNNSPGRIKTKSVPEGKIKELYYHYKWVPIFGDYSGNFIGIDLDPGPTGKVGQVICFGRDCTEMHVLAPSLGELFKRLRQKGVDKIRTDIELWKNL